MNKKKIWLLISITLFGVWYYVANHTDVFSDDRIFYGYYSDVRGLQESSPVYVKGVKVGRVEEIDLNLKDKVLVAFSLNEDLKIPQGTKAIITTGDIAGSKSVRLELGNGNALNTGSVLLTDFDSTMAENFDSKITPIIHSSKVLLHSSDSALNSFNQFIKRGWGDETRKSFATVNVKLGKAAVTIGKANQKIQQSENLVNSLDSITANPARKNASLNKKISDAEKSSGNAARKNIGQELKDLNTSIIKLSSSLTKARQNKLLSDTQMYHNASKSLDTLHRSTKDYMENPPPFINIGFGGKKDEK
ncbi:MAG TPA: MlaD family protein [Flavipsychrobacter sp.]|nr:MlaD family protein [Flavipsychrobacter sp.]